MALMNYSNQPPLTQRPTPTITLVAHDEMKEDLLALMREYTEFLLECSLVAARGDSIETALKSGFSINLLHAPGMGGELQVASLVVDGLVDAVIHFGQPKRPVAAGRRGAAQGVRHPQHRLCRQPGYR